jgi:DNA-binding LacI/PurR family transcriptional regulator
LPKSSKTKSNSVLRSTAEFADHVGLARTTVSRVLNGQPGLKQSTIDRVQRALAETGFTPNAHALHLKGKRTSLIGICMEDLITPPAVKKLAALQKLLRDRGFSSLMEVLTPGTGREVVRHFLSMRVEAVVFIGNFHREEMEARIVELAAHGMPHLFIDQYGLAGANTISLDRAAGMNEAVTHLLDQGHRHFGLLAVARAPQSRYDRMTGIRAALRARRLEFDRATLSLDHLHERSNDFEYGRRLAGSFLQQSPRPTALLALNDEIAIGAVGGLQDAGLKVPRDLSVIGFNNQEVSLLISPTLTTVDQNIAETVAAAAEVLLAQLTGQVGAKPVVRLIKPTFIVRESTGPARGA